MTSPAALLVDSAEIVGLDLAGCTGSEAAASQVCSADTDSAVVPKTGFAAAADSAYSEAWLVAGDIVRFLDSCLLHQTGRIGAVMERIVVAYPVVECEVEGRIDFAWERSIAEFAALGALPLPAWWRIGIAAAVFAEGSRLGQTVLGGPAGAGRTCLEAPLPAAKFGFENACLSALLGFVGSSATEAGMVLRMRVVVGSCWAAILVVRID